jgi:phosphoribosylformimino-5-aminoimidazole carboxamide ribotide isomerase
MQGRQPFHVYPAVDLRAGRVVRLKQGDPDRQTAYSHRPEEIARRWALAGASWLHVVNLDGAFGESGLENQEALHAILETVSQLNPRPEIQFGGGLRTLTDVKKILDMGVRRVVLGTVAVENPKVAAEAVAEHGAGAIAVGIDARDGRVMVHGWAQDSGLDPVALGRSLKDMGLCTAIYTDVRRDGMGVGVDIQGAHRLAEETSLTVIASGGVRSLDDIRSARDHGLSGVIVGKALYEGQINLEEALAC